MILWKSTTQLSTVVGPDFRLNNQDDIHVGPITLAAQVQLLLNIYCGYSQSIWPDMCPYRETGKKYVSELNVQNTLLDTLIKLKPPAISPTPLYYFQRFNSYMCTI